jgi:pimeloyl-ACP methyl ester carboxylesterase
MRQFQKVIQELKDVVSNHQPGDALTPPPSLPFIEVNGRKLHYAQAGMDHGTESPPVVLLHGFGGFFMDWPRVMAPIARHTRVYAVDLPGWGFSEPNYESKTLEDEVRTVNEFCARLGLSQVILCGISYGAGVAWAAASMNLLRIKHVVLLNPMPPYPVRYMHSALYQGVFLANSSMLTALIGHHYMTKPQYKIVCRENLLNDRLLDTFYLDLAYMVIKQPKIPRMLVAHAEGARTINWHDWEHRLAGVRIPVSILQGDKDRIFSMKSALYLHRLIPTSELIQVADCGHAMVFDQHKRVSEFLIRLLPRKEKHEPAQEILRKQG